MNDREILRLISRVSQLESEIRLINDVVVRLQRRLEHLEAYAVAQTKANEEIRKQLMKHVEHEKMTPVYPDF